MREMRVRYARAASRKEKIRLVKEVSTMLRCHREHAGLVLRGHYWQGAGKRYRERIYPDKLIDILAEIWKASLYPWSVRLKALLPLWLVWILRRWKLTSQEQRQLLAMSPATIDRRLKPYKERLGRKLYGKTKPGRWIKQGIPIHTEWHGVMEPGWEEVDTVSHSGPSAQGMFAYTANQTDLLSGWVESRAILGKGAVEVKAAMEEMLQAVPFEELGIDSDNGEEYINYHLERWCKDHGLKRFRSRPNKKDDQAHIEQKNGTHVRRLIGWHRYDTQAAVDALNDLYRNERSWLMNLFLPSVRLEKKIRRGSRIKRIYDDAKTPLDRLVESKKGIAAKVEAFQQLRRRLDPFELSQALDKKLETVWKLASENRIKAAPTAYVPTPKPSWPRLPLKFDPPAPWSPVVRDSDLRRIRKMGWRDRFFGTQ